MNMKRKRAIAVAFALALAAATGAALLRPRAPRTVWCQGDDVGVIRTRPDGPEVPHGATMSAVGAPWAYYYDLPDRFTLLLARFRTPPLRTTLLLATGREVVTGSGRWREFVRSGDAEFEAVLGWWRTRAGDLR